MTTLRDVERLQRYQDALARVRQALSYAPAGAPANENGSTAREDTLPERLSVDQYHELIRAGVLTDDDPVELLEGALVAKMTKNPPHRLATQLVRELLDKLVPPGWHINSQEPITLQSSEPEPDVTVIRGQRRDYRDRHPGAADVGLVVEVADSSLANDQGFKKGIYARGGISIYWIVNLLETRVEVYTQIAGAQDEVDYQQCQEFGPADAVPFVLDGQEVGRVPVKDILP